MPIRFPPDDGDSESATTTRLERPERPAAPAERRPSRPSLGTLPAPQSRPKRTKVGGMVPLERAAKSGRLPALAGKKKRSSMAKRFRDIVGAGGSKSDSSESDDFGDSKSIYDDED